MTIRKTIRSTIRRPYYDLVIPGSGWNQPPAILRDGNTVAWYDSKDLNTITKDGNNLVSKWSNKIVGSKDLVQTVDLKKPIYSSDGIYFDGIDDFIASDVFTTIQQPFSIYILIKQISYTAGRDIINLYNLGSLYLYQSASVPEIRAHLGVAGTMKGGLDIGSWGVIRLIGNGANSKLTVNNLYSTFENLGANGINIIALASKHNGSAYWSNIALGEIIIRNGVDSDNSSELIYKYLNTKAINKQNGYEFDNGKFIITFDDITASQYSLAYPILLSNNCKATFYAIGTSIGNTPKVTWDNVAEMIANGMDIQCHTNTHAHLTSLTEAQVIAELQALNDAFTSHSLPVPLHIAYPFGEENTSIETYVSGLRRTGRLTGTIRSQSFYKNVNHYQIPAIPIDAITATDLSDLKLKMNNAQSRKSAIVVYTHGVSETGGTYEVPRASFESLITHAKSIGMDIVTISELYAQLNP